MHCTLLMLLPAWGTAEVPLPPSTATELPWHVPSSARSLPYLPLLGAPPLRFQEVAPVPRLQTRIPAAAPPFPKQTEPDLSPADATEPVPAMRPAISEPPTAASGATSEPVSKPAAPILHDDISPRVRPEDFLPYFQFPRPAASTPEAGVIVPLPLSAPAAGPSIPPSSATFSQEPE